MARDHVGTGLPARLVWSYDEPRGRLAELYEDAKQAQWDASDVDWSKDADPGALPGAECGVAEVDWASLGDPLTTALGTEPDVVRAILSQQHGWLVSQLLHGEQGALVATAKLCATADSIDAKACAALQLADEARHLEAYRRYLDLIGIHYDVSPDLANLLAQAIGHRSFDLTYVGTQILVEGAGLIAAHLGGPIFGNPLLGEIIQRIGQDEARHVEFGVVVLDGLYPQMDPVDRREREDFVLEACAVLRSALRPVPVWDHFGIDVAAAAARWDDSPDVAAFHALVFSRIVADLQRLGLLTARVRDGFQAMGVLDFGPFEDVGAAGATELADDPLLGDGRGPEGPGGPDRSGRLRRPERAERGGAAGGGEDREGRGGRRGYDRGGHDRGGNGDEVEVRPAGMVAGEAPDPLLALRAALGCVEQIAPEPVLMAMCGLVDAPRLAGLPRARIQLAVSGAGEGDWLVTVDDDQVRYRPSQPADRPDVAVEMDQVTWTEIVSGRVSLSEALATGRIAVAGDVFRARALEALL